MMINGRAGPVKKARSSADALQRRGGFRPDGFVRVAEGLAQRRHGVVGWCPDIPQRSGRLLPHASVHIPQSVSQCPNGISSLVTHLPQSGGRLLAQRWGGLLRQRRVFADECLNEHGNRYPGCLTIDLQERQSIV